MSFILNCEPLSNSVWVTIEFFLFLHDYKYPTENTISTLSMRREPEYTWNVYRTIQYTLPLYSPCGISYTYIVHVTYINLTQTYQLRSQRVALILRCILQGLSSLLVVIATDDVKWQELHLSSAFTHYIPKFCILSLYTSFIQPITSIVSNPFLMTIEAYFDRT